MTGTGTGTGTRTDRNVNENGNGNRDGEQDVRGREPESSPKGSRGWAENARERVTSTGTRQRQSQDSTPQRERRIMCWARVQGHEGTDGIGKGEAVENKDKRLLVQ